MTARTTVQFALPDSKMCLVLEKPKNIPQGRPLPPEIFAQADLPTPDSSESWHVLPCSASTVRASEKVQLWLIGSRTRAFQRAIDEVRTLPLSLPIGGSESDLFFFGIKVNCNWMKSATKFRWEKTSSGRLVVHSFPYLTVHRCWGKL